MNDEVAALRAEVERLRAEIEKVDDWAQGIHLALETVLPFLLRGHPEAGEVQRLLQSLDERYEELLKHPGRAEAGERRGQLESPKMLYRRLALQDVWPGADSKEAACQTLERAGWRDPSIKS
jgi:hypothetical protein